MINKALKYIRIVLNPFAFERERARLRRSIEKKDRKIEALQGKISKKDRKIEGLQGKIGRKDRQIEALQRIVKPPKCMSPHMLSERFQADGKPGTGLNDLRLEIKNQIETKVEQGIYAFERVPCCICDGYDLERLSEKDRYGLYAPVGICINCGLIQANPRMSQEAYQQFYEVEYEKLHAGKNGQEDRKFNLEYIRGSEIYAYLKQILSTPLRHAKVLEVGCSSGGILQYFKEQENHVCGCDLDPEIVKFGKDRHDLELQVGTVYDLTLSWKPDIVIYSHTLEHILTPVEELMKVRSIMAEDATLYIEAPSIKNIPPRYQSDLLMYLQTAHVYYFTLTTLKNLLRKAGFDLIDGDEFIRSISRVAAEPQKDASIENDYATVMKLLSKLESTWEEMVVSQKL